ncbi:hypothetical protein N9C48_00275 [bacterium]|nr:hypothetical protein [bacterium]MDA9938525.1 hypothetical protein [bacterium]
MSATDRQNRLLVAEDWKTIYQSFRNADFQSYDFDNLRRTMIEYLRTNYPEDFNDYIESSEYLALIDLVAFLGQNLSFRIDLNARENFLELAERRESVLRLARLLNYNPRRNQSANGLLKFTAISTTEDLIDSNGTNLASQTIQWNDSTNSNWYEQFIKVINSSLPVNGVFGKPNKSEIVSGISTDQYRVNGVNTDVPVFAFEKPIEGKTTPFEIVSTDIEDGSLIEEAPVPGNNFAFMYRNDAQGPGSSNTGFFAHFRQGRLESGQFSVTQPTPNQTVSIDTENINDSDVWLFKLDGNNNESELWSKLDAVEGNNVIYNSINKKVRNIYSVLTRVDDRINLAFSDGVFGNLPKGNFKTYFRTSENRNMVITPTSISNISVNIPYLSKKGRVHTLTLTMSLETTVANSARAETSLSIKQNAPATYYTQNRMITGEDYNVAPLGISQEIVKVKSVNRTSSGISRYFDLNDATGKYSNTNLYGNDGVIYKEYTTEKTSFNFNTQTDIEGIIINNVEPILDNKKVKHFYLDKFPKINTVDLNVYWNAVTEQTNTYTGKFQSLDAAGYQVGTFTTNSLKYIEAGTAIKFQAPTGFHFMEDGSLMAGDADHLGSALYKWTKVIAVAGNGLDVGLAETQGPIALADKIPTNCRLIQIRPMLANSLLDDVKVEIIDQTFAYNDFGLRYDDVNRVWRLVKATDLDKRSNFSTGFAGNVSNGNLDASWLLLFETNGETYKITYRGLRYVFESDREIKFYYDSSDKIYDTQKGKVIRDKLCVLNINTQPDSALPFTSGFDFDILESYRDKEGYVDTKKIEVTFADKDADGVIDDPELFLHIVDEDVNPLNKIIIHEKYLTDAGVEEFRYVESTNIQILESQTNAGPLSSYTDGQVFYFRDNNVFKKLDSTILELVTNSDYKAFVGRDKLKFHYVHVADTNNRIDPSASNIIDTYMLTKTYDRNYRLFIDGQILQQPLPPSSDELYRSYGRQLNKIKSISDEVIYHPVKYKELFGSLAKTNLQATFKVVKNPDQVLNDNDVKTRCIEAINQYFALENWNFGDTFYFQELATYITNRLAPDLVSVVIVPDQPTQSFGSLFEVRSEVDEIFINSATVADIEIIDQITATRLNASGRVVTSSETANTGITSATSFTSSNSSNSSNNSSSGGSYY